MMVIHDYEKRCEEAFMITKIQMYKHEPFYFVGGGGLFVVLYCILAIQ